MIWRSFPGTRLEALSGDRKGQFSICINDQFRINLETLETSTGMQFAGIDKSRSSDPFDHPHPFYSHTGEL